MGRQAASTAGALDRLVAVAPANKLLGLVVGHSKDMVDGVAQDLFKGPLLVDAGKEGGLAGALPLGQAAQEARDVVDADCALDLLVIVAPGVFKVTDHATINTGRLRVA